MKNTKKGCELGAGEFQEPGGRGGVIASVLQVKSISFVTLWVNNWTCSVDSGGNSLVSQLCFPVPHRVPLRTDALDLSTEEGQLLQK